ncbi:hypothetical protein Bdt_0905 [Bdellovibrio bacteriovorus str. Tiberius]|uniref:Methyltransferase n=1 Tax=Bdellovibrio bacteriovorus str. Tiberius TaxID=1069642 RepID=K7YV91_BDEBC|nr:hypothetical protein Bdt_0905 [Bdellovibrio bacteriovorus str. Tiberius]
MTTALPFAAQASAAARCEAIFTFAKVEKSDPRAFENLTKYEQLFTKGRGLETYKVVLGNDFAQSLSRVLQKQDGHWFDSGAGHAFAVRQALQAPEGQYLKSTVVAYETSAKSAERLNVISGRFLETIADKEIAKSDLITDVFGPLAYSGQPHQVMQKYLNNLKPDGEIYIFLGARHELYGEFNKVITAKGEVLNLGQWLETIPGIRAELVKTPKEDDGTRYEMWTIKITKTDENAKVPAVEMIHFKEGAPPVMSFKEVANNGLTNHASLQEKARATFRERSKNITATEFLDAFRGGELRHPLIASIKGLKREDRWVNSSEVGAQVFAGMKSKDYDYSDTSVFVGLSQKFIRWRASRINTDKINYTPVSDSALLKDVRDVKLITDYHGDFMSSFAPDIVLGRYLESLSNKGEIYLYTGKEYGGFGSDSMVMRKDGTQMPLRQWLRQIPGVNTSLFRGGYHWTGGEWTFLKVTIKDRNKIKIPKLKLMGTTEGKDGLPLPFFEEI